VRCTRALHARAALTLARSARRRGGVPIYFPQFGPGDNSPGSIPGQPALQLHGFARNMMWVIVKTVRLRSRPFARDRRAENLRAQGLTDFEKWPFVRLRLRDTPYSRSMWDHAFELEYEVTLGERHVIMRLVVRNTGDSDFAFTTALNSCIAVHDIRLPQRSFYKVCIGCCRAAEQP
jgi:glucose-6-phosphate 1-epimerase